MFSQPLPPAETPECFLWAFYSPVPTSNLMSSCWSRVLGPGSLPTEPEDGFCVLWKYLMLWPAGPASRAGPAPVGQGQGPEPRGQGKGDRGRQGASRESSHNCLQPGFCTPPRVSICGMGPVLGNVCGHSPRSSVGYLSTMSPHTLLSLFLYREKVLSEVNLWSYMSPMLRFHSRQPWQYLASQVV